MSPRVRLPNGALPVSRIGFGCSYLTGGFEAGASQRLVHAAFDLGVRHFDVAPSYGLGTAEEVLGKALRGRRNEATIATKVGIKGSRMTLRMQMLRLAATPVRKLWPALSHRAGARVLGASSVHGQFGIDDVRASVERSLRDLRTDRLDALLLHEVAAADITDELLAYLQKLRRDGVVGAVGLASGVDRLSGIPLETRSLFDWTQYPWSVLDPQTCAIDPSGFHVTHGAILRAHGRLLKRFRDDAAFLARLRNQVCADIHDPDRLGQVLLGAAIARNPTGLTLVGSRRRSRIMQNAALLTDDRLVEAGSRLAAALAQADEPSVLADSAI